MNKKLLKLQRHQIKRAKRQLKARIKRNAKLRKRRKQNDELVREFLKYWPKPEAKAKLQNSVEQHRWLTYWRYKHIEAPKRFSLIENTESTLQFIRKLENTLTLNQKTFVVLRNVTTIDETAIVVLLSIMIRFKKNGILFNGDAPTDPVARRLFKNSDFLKELYNLPLRRLEQLSGADSNIYSGTSKKVNNQLASKVLRESSLTIWGKNRKLTAVYENLIELMLNTHNHAEIGHRGTRNWYLVVKHMRQEKKVSFAFVDYGVGIIASLAGKKQGDSWYIWFNKLKLLFNGQNSANAQILQRIFIGEERTSSTGLPHRGYGLPNLYKSFKEGDIKNLFVITNDVSVDAVDNKFSTLSIPFKGTFVYWELDDSCATLQSSN